MSAVHMKHVVHLHIHRQRTDQLNDNDTLCDLLYAVDVRKDMFGKH